LLFTGLVISYSIVIGPLVRITKIWIDSNYDWTKKHKYMNHIVAAQYSQEGLNFKHKIGAKQSQVNKPELLFHVITDIIHY